TEHPAPRRHHTPWHPKAKQNSAAHQPRTTRRISFQASATPQASSFHVRSRRHAISCHSIPRLGNMPHQLTTPLDDTPFRLIPHKHTPSHSLATRHHKS